ncbi:MAG TPA: hypothetical protein VE958_01285 [Bryobacteraceae bacterium]|nr:hypothetical protein [Bryobacteraceae bacterium]
MDENIRVFGETLGRRALAKDWAGVRAMLAPWMQRSLSVEEVRCFFENEYRSLLEESGVKGMHYPEYPDPEVGGNTYMNASRLREPIEFQNKKIRPVAPEVTDENMRFWMKLQLQCSDQQMARFGFDYFCEVWMAVVETPAGLGVGYWSQGAY